MRAWLAATAVITRSSCQFSRQPEVILPDLERHSECLWLLEALTQLFLQVYKTRAIPFSVSIVSMEQCRSHAT